MTEFHLASPALKPRAGDLFNIDAALNCPRSERRCYRSTRPGGRLSRIKTGDIAACLNRVGGVDRTVTT